MNPNGTLKDGLSPCKTRPFAGQKTAFYKAVRNELIYSYLRNGTQKAADKHKSLKKTSRR